MVVGWLAQKFMNHVRIAQYLASVRVRVVTTFCLRLRALVTCNLTVRMMPVASRPLLFPSERSDTCTVVRRLRSEDDVWCGSVVLPKPGHVTNAPSRGRDAKTLTHLDGFLSLSKISKRLPFQSIKQSDCRALVQNHTDLPGPLS